MASRNDLKKQKEKTSQALIQAALQLCAEEGYASLSLRSVARKAGIAPTSFYRHFREIDEMGVEMVAQAKAVLDDCLAKARKKMALPANKKGASPADLAKSIEGITRPFVDTFLNFFKKNNRLLHLFFQERTGGSEAMRIAIAKATDQLIDHLIELLGNDLIQPGKTSKNKTGNIRLVAEAMLMIVSRSGMEMQVQPEGKPGDINARTVRKLNFLLLGALIQD
ncbi:MAG: TetR family transcriptional regulator [Deltaproteobacteria bacterium]|nr:TetR family transcriptional regulator [Deltaproteobacteria bacterium]